MKTIISLDIFCNYVPKLLGVIKCLKSIDYRFTKYFLFLLIATNHFVLFSQTNENNFNKVIIEVDGETVTSVYKITQDHQGYMWMKTNLGLIRYDGIEGKKYYSDSSSNDFTRIDALYVDSQGDIWIGSRSGLSKYNPDCDCFYHYPSVIDDIAPLWVRSITEDKNNNIWFGIGNYGIYQYERESDSITRFLQKPSDSLIIINNLWIGELLVDQFNNLWIGTDTGLVRYNIDTGNIKKFVHDPADPSSLSSNLILALYEDQQGQLLIGTQKSGFHIYDPKSGALNRINYDDKNPNQIHAPYSEEFVQGYEPFVNLIHQDQNGDYWIGTAGKGLNHFSTRAKTFNNYTLNMVNPQMLYSIYEDRQGNLWVGGGMGSGLFKTNLFAPKYQLNTTLTQAGFTYESSKHPGILWVGIYNKGFRKLNTKTNKITDYIYSKEDTNSIKHDMVRSIYQENKNNLWIGLGAGGTYGGHGGDGGVDRMNIETEVFTHFKITRDDDEEDGFSYTVHSICEDNEGYLWVGAGPGGIFRSDKDKKEFKHFKISKNDNSLEYVVFNIVRMDSNGDLWAADFAGDGTLYLYDRQENKFKPYLNGIIMYNLLVDDKGWLWISTWNKGFLHLNPKDKSFVQYTKREGLPSNNGIDIVKGENGIYWIGTRMGPAKMDTKTGKISSIGLPKSRYNRGIFKANNGQIYLGTTNGLLSFYPDQEMENPYPPQINISELLIADENYLTNKNESEELNLSYKQNDISFKYVAIHFSDPEKNSYQYKLDPLDDNWINASYERGVRFANLSPGTYNFQVKAANSDGVWSDEIAAVQFTIKSPWWTTWWAYALFTTILLSILHLLYRFNLKRRLAVAETSKAKEIEELKSKMFANISHEFRTPLTIISGLSNELLEDNENEAQRNLLKGITYSNKQLLNLVNQMLDLSSLDAKKMIPSYKNGDIIIFIEKCVSLFKSYSDSKLLTLKFKSEVSNLTMDFDDDKLQKIVNNLLSNAIKFTPEKGEINVHLKQIKNQLRIIVSDTGIGIEKKELSQIFERYYKTYDLKQNIGTGIGLALTKELVKLLQGSISIDSKVGIGTTFIVDLPIQNTSIKADTFHKTPFIDYDDNYVSQIKKGDKEKTPHTILLVEDNKEIRNFIKLILSDLYTIYTANNGVNGLKVANNKPIDFIISDVMMPEMDGFEFCKHIKKDINTSHIPFVIISARTETKDKVEAYKLGVDAYLIKPFNKQELLLIIKNLLGKKQKQIRFLSNLLHLRNNHKEVPDINELDLNLIKNIQEFALDNHKQMSIEELAQYLYTSRSQLHKKVKSLTGMSITNYMNHIRIEKAKDLLKTTQLTISEIAYDVGFVSSNYFARSFKKITHTSPASYRQGHS